MRTNAVNNPRQKKFHLRTIRITQSDFDQIQTLAKLYDLNSQLLREVNPSSSHSNWRDTPPHTIVTIALHEEIQKMRQCVNFLQCQIQKQFEDCVSANLT